jgi:hypothetical protein
MGSESPNVILYDVNGQEMSVSNGAAIPAGTSALMIAGSDGTNSRFITLDTSGRPVTVGAGTAGTPAGGVLSVQGVSGGQALPVTISGGTNTVNQGSVNPSTLQAWTFRLINSSDGYSEAAFGNDGRLTVGLHTLMFTDTFEGTTIDTNRWTQSQSGMTQSQATGQLNLNSGNATTSNAYTILTSLKYFPLFYEYPIYVSGLIKFTAQTNATLEAGIGNPSTNSAVTDGAFFQTVGGNINAVLAFNGTQTSTVLAPVSAINTTNFYRFEIVIEDDQATFSIQSHDFSVNINATINVPATNPTPNSISHLPIFGRIFNGSPGPSSAAIATIGNVTVALLDVDTNKSWSEQMASSSKSSSIDPSTLAQSANYTNNTGPATGTLSNTAAAYTTLGGLFQVAAPAGAETDYALFAYQVPASPGATLFIWSITMGAFIVGAQSTTSSTVLQWAVGTNSSAVSLATGAPNPPIRSAIGMQQAPKTAAVGDSFNPPSLQYQPKTPLVIFPGHYLHIILRVPVGNATSSQLIRGFVTVEGYFQ